MTLLAIPLLTLHTYIYIDEILMFEFGHKKVVKWLKIG